MKQLTSIFYLNLLLVMFLQHTANAQIKEASFYETRISQFNEWLADRGLINYIATSGFEPTGQVLNVYLNFKDANTWQQLVLDGNSVLPIALFQKMKQYLLLPGNALIMNFKGEDYYFKVRQNDAGIVVDYPSPMGENPNIGEPLEIAYLGSLSARVATVVKGKTEREISMILIDFLRKKFKPRYIKDKEEFKPIVLGGSIDLTITNVKRVILDSNYFEKIEIYIRILEGKDNGLLIECHVVGSYGSGIGKPPKDTDYRDMEKKFSKRLQKFNDEIRSDIYQLFSAP